jgi:hypothetical protein
MRTCDPVIRTPAAAEASGVGADARIDATSNRAGACANTDVPAMSTQAKVRNRITLTSRPSTWTTTASSEFSHGFEALASRREIA